MAYLLSAFADEHSNEFNKQLEYLSQNDVKFLEVRFVDGKNISDVSDSEINAIKNNLISESIKISAIGSPLGKINLNEDFDAHIEKTKRVCYIANELDTINIRMFSFYLPDGIKREDAKEEVISRLGKMIDVADSFGVTLCHENEAKIYGESPENCAELLNWFGGKMRA